MLINEVARIAGMSKDGVRHYEEMGLIGSRPRRAGSRTYRDYDGPLLKAYGTANLTAEETVAFLEQRLSAIREKQAELRQVEDFICSKLDRYRHMVPTAPC
jgi:DNA-binding transcriptional MerR regulator